MLSLIDELRICMFFFYLEKKRIEGEKIETIRYKIGEKKIDIYMYIYTLIHKNNENLTNPPCFVLSLFRFCFFPIEFFGHFFYVSERRKKIRERKKKT